MRTMYDAVTPENVPTDAQMVAGYIDGRYRSFDPLVRRCPGAVHVPIAVNAGTNGGLVLDVEQGDATPGEAPGWVQMRRENGTAFPWVYCSLAVWADVRNTFRLTGVPEPVWWIAAYPGNGPNLYPGSLAHQYASGPFGVGGGDVDLSVVADVVPGLDGPGPSPTRKRKRKHPMNLVAHIVDGPDAGWVAFELGKPAFVHLRDAEAQAAVASEQAINLEDRNDVQFRRLLAGKNENTGQ